MFRGASIALLVLGACAAGAAAQHKTAPAQVSPGSAWQSIPPATRTAAGDTNASKRKSPDRAAAARTAKASPAKRLRNPMPAADTPRRAPVETAAARTKEFSRRLDVLAPGAKVDEPMFDAANPSWRRQPDGRAAAESRAFSMRLDESGRSGFVARAYHQDRSWYNTNSSTGATFGLRTRF